MVKWDERFLRLAREISTWSKDRSTRVGAVIIGEDKTPGPYGFNGFPRFVDDDRESRHERPEKYKWTEHAERNAIYNAARIGVPLKGCTMYVTHMPCADCARAISLAVLTGTTMKPLTLTSLAPGSRHSSCSHRIRPAVQVAAPRRFRPRRLGPSAVGLPAHDV